MEFRVYVNDEEIDIETVDQEKGVLIEAIPRGAHWSQYLPEDKAEYNKFLGIRNKFINNAAQDFLKSGIGVAGYSALQYNDINIALINLGIIAYSCYMVLSGLGGICIAAFSQILVKHIKNNPSKPITYYQELSLKI